jgi:tetratricopeptide (TPR) repeat protein
VKLLNNKKNKNLYNKMNQNRLQQLQKYFEEDPGDPFNIYAIAIEYNNFDKSKAKEYYDILLKDHPEYVPTYYHAALLYAESGQKDTASSIFEKGIAIAKTQNNLHALRELQSAFNNFLYEDEE